MSRGNYYYAMGWVGERSNSWGGGEIARVDDWRDGMITSLMLIVLGAMLQAFSAFADVSWLASTLPLFSLVFGILGIISMFSLPGKGILFSMTKYNKLPVFIVCGNHMAKHKICRAPGCAALPWRFSKISEAFRQSKHMHQLTRIFVSLRIQHFRIFCISIPSINIPKTG